MALKQIDAILWRRYLAATSTALFGLSASQYYIEMPPASDDYLEFLNGTGSHFTDPQGNKCVTFHIAEFDGSNAQKYAMTFKILAPGKAREGYININDQNPKNGYPLWLPPRGPLKVFEKSVDAYAPQFAVIVRDVHNAFHARWIRHEDFLALPDKIRGILSVKDAGWSLL
jgi:hypothetical protein